MFSSRLMLIKTVSRVKLLEDTSRGTQNNFQVELKGLSVVYREIILLSFSQTPACLSVTFPFPANQIFPSKIWKADLEKEKQMCEAFFNTNNLVGYRFSNASVVIGLNETINETIALGGGGG